MRLGDKIYSLGAMLRVRFLHQRIPLAVRLQVTNRCTLACKYCNLWRIKIEELSTNEIFRLIDELGRLGSKRISLSGGEPLLRSDIAEIVTYCRRKGLYPEMNSNGTLVPQKIEALRHLDFLKLSLDGPRQAHDALRGEGSYDKLITAAEFALKHKVKFGFACTLTKYNINHLDVLLKVAEKYNTIVAFQPLKEIYRGADNISELKPSPAEFKQAIANLIIEKKRGNTNIRNSLIGLRHIYDWPEYKKLKCWAGYIFCIINLNGDVYPCDRVDYDIRLPNYTKIGLEKALKEIPDVHCDGCGFCGALELNYLMRFRFNILWTIRKIING